jgi:hypothetical protein
MRAAASGGSMRRSWVGPAPGKDLPNSGAQGLNIPSGGLGEAALDVAEEGFALAGVLRELLQGDTIGSAEAAKGLALSPGGFACEECRLGHGWCFPPATLYYHYFLLLSIDFP